MALVRTITHWTAGPGRATSIDKEHYHFITEWDGTIVKGKEEPEDNIVTADDDYARHTLNLNTGSIGLAMAGMQGAIENPFEPGPTPITEKQFRAHCILVAEMHRRYGIPVTPETCLTHAEVQGTLGVRQRGKWDITRLTFRPDLVGPKAVGDYLRALVQEALGTAPVADTAHMPTLRLGTRGVAVRQLQTYLKDTRYFPGLVDGDFGNRTRAAVLAFQADAGLQPDGVVGPVTWAALIRAEPRPERDVTEADLIREGSRTLQGAAGATGAAALGGVTTTVAVVVEQAQEAQAALAASEGLLEKGSALVSAYWPALLVLASAALVWYFLREVRRARVEDARSGANVSR